MVNSKRTQNHFFVVVYVAAVQFRDWENDFSLICSFILRLLLLLLSSIYNSFVVMYLYSYHWFLLFTRFSFFCWGQNYFINHNMSNFFLFALSYLWDWVTISSTCPHVHLCDLLSAFHSIVWFRWFNVSIDTCILLLLLLIQCPFVRFIRN